MTVEQYIYWVDLLAIAKKMKDYEIADDARKMLHQVQNMGDGYFIAMHDSGQYRWHPMFSPSHQARVFGHDGGERIEGCPCEACG